MNLQTERTIPTKKKLRSTTKREGEGDQQSANARTQMTLQTERTIETKRKLRSTPTDTANS